MKLIKSYKSTICSFSIILLLCFGTNLKAQVTIGANLEPNKGALLDLKERNPVNSSTDNSTTNKGLGMPRVNLTTLTAISDINEAAGKEAEHIGLIVYNVNKVDAANIQPGLYVWDGSLWRPLKTS